MKDGQYCENHLNVTQTRGEQVLPATWQRDRPWAQGPRRAAVCEERRRARPPSSVTVGKYGRHKVGHLHTCHVCSAVALGTFTVLCSCHRCPSTELSYHPNRKAAPAETDRLRPPSLPPADLPSPLDRALAASRAAGCHAVASGLPADSHVSAPCHLALLQPQCSLSVMGAVKPPSRAP